MTDTMILPRATTSRQTTGHDGDIFVVPIGSRIHVNCASAITFADDSTAHVYSGQAFNTGGFTPFVVVTGGCGDSLGPVVLPVLPKMPIIRIDTTRIQVGCQVSVLVNDAVID